MGRSKRPFPRAALDCPLSRRRPGARGTHTAPPPLPGPRPRGPLGPLPPPTGRAAQLRRNSGSSALKWGGRERRGASCEGVVEGAGFGVATRAGCGPRASPLTVRPRAGPGLPGLRSERACGEPAPEPAPLPTGLET